MCVDADRHDGGPAEAVAPTMNQGSYDGVAFDYQKVTPDPANTERKVSLVVEGVMLSPEIARAFRACVQGELVLGDVAWPGAMIETWTDDGIAVFLVKGHDLVFGTT